MLPNMPTRVEIRRVRAGVGLLEDGEIPHRKIGRHRRVLLADLLDYKRLDDQQRRRAADELGELGEELGI
jgi:hypothetical protein